MKHDKCVLKISTFFFVAILGIESNISANTLSAENSPFKNLQDPVTRSQLCVMRATNMNTLNVVKSLAEEVDSAELQQSLESMLQATNTLFEKNNISVIEYCKIRPRPRAVRDPRHTSPATEYPRR